MHLSERGAVEVELVVDHFVYSFLHFVHIVDGHYFCCTLVRELQPTVSLNLRFTMSAFHTRIQFHWNQAPMSPCSVNAKCGRHALSVLLLWSIFVDAFALSPSWKGIHFSLQLPSVYGSLHSSFFFTLGWNLTTHTQLRSPNCAVTSMRAWESKINTSNQYTITNQNLFAEDSRIST